MTKHGKMNQNDVHQYFNFKYHSYHQFQLIMTPLFEMIKHQ